MRNEKLTAYALIRNIFTHNIYIVLDVSYEFDFVRVMTFSQPHPARPYLPRTWNMGLNEVQNKYEIIAQIDLNDHV